MSKIGRKPYVLLGSLVAMALSIQLWASKPIYIDVRSWAEHQIDSIEGYVHIHSPDVVEQINNYTQQKDQAIYVYCGVGGRAEKAKQALLSAGFTNVTNMGGINDARVVRGLEQ